MLPPVASCVVSFRPAKSDECNETSCSGIFVGKRVILAPACILADKSDPETLQGSFSITHLSYDEWHEECQPVLVTNEAILITVFTCNEISASLDLLFRNEDISLTADSQEKDNRDLLSKFILLKKCNAVKNLSDQSNENYETPVWPKSVEICRAMVRERLLLCSTPFGRTNPDMFFNTWTSGIVANNLNGGGLLLCDISCVPGSQGGLVYNICKTTNQMCAIAMVLHPVIWRHQEPSGLCIAGAFDRILHSLMCYESEIGGMTLNFDLCSCHKRQNLEIDMRYLVKVVMQSSWGSGIMISSRYILTCAHVINGHHNYTPRIKLQFTDMLFKGTVVYCSQNGEDFDVAVLKLPSVLPRKDRTHVKIANSMQVGENVFACGYGMFKEQRYATITSGILSKVAASGFSISTSCHVYSGCSGGALVNAKGELIALLLAHTMMTNDAQELIYTNLSFGIPMSLLKRAISILANHDTAHEFLKLEASCVKAKL